MRSTSCLNLLSRQTARCFLDYMVSPRYRGLSGGTWSCPVRCCADCESSGAQDLRRRGQEGFDQDQPCLYILSSTGVLTYSVLYCVILCTIPYRTVQYRPIIMVWLDEDKHTPPGVHCPPAIGQNPQPAPTSSSAFETKL
jgi:hypothetical protein